MTEELDNIIVLSDENGDDVNFEFLDLVEIDGEEYVVLLPAGPEYEEGDAAEVVILQIESIDEEADLETYVSVEDEETLARVFEAFKEKFADELNFAE